MPTFMFRNTIEGTVYQSTARSLNAARDKLAGTYGLLHFHDGDVWVPWECWDGGKCLWHMTYTGECVEGPRGITL